MLLRVVLPKEAKLLGINSGELEIKGSGADTIVRLIAEARAKVVAALANASHDRFYLALENIRGTYDPAVLYAQIALPENALAGNRFNVQVGSVALYGLRKASMPGNESRGLTFVLDSTLALTELFTVESPYANDIRVRILAHRELPASTRIVIGRVSIFSCSPN